MHIAEGILPAPWAAACFVASAPFVYAGLRRVRTVSQEVPSFKALVGLMGAAVFVISVMPIPVPTVGTCSHPAGTGMAAILVGPLVSVLLSTIALVIQTIFLAHGGITTLGANILSMGVIGSFAGYAAFRGLRAVNAPFWLAAFAAGLASDWATYTGTSFIMAVGLHGDGSLWGLFGAILLAFVPTQLPLGILEGVITAGMAGYVLKNRPDILQQLRVIPPALAKAASGMAGVAGALALILALPSPVAAGEKSWEGVDAAVVGKIAEQHGRPPVETVFNSISGDALLFAFALGGAVGGFILGYLWRGFFQHDSSTNNLNENLEPGKSHASPQRTT